MLRAFIAIQLSEELKGQIGHLQAELKRQARIAALGWTRPEGIHLTLKFLGDIAEGQVEELRTVLRQVTATAMPFELEARGLGVFPNVRQARVLWLGLRGEPAAMETLRCLQAAVENAVAGLGFPKETRAFRPHLTLARIRDRDAGMGAALEQILAGKEDLPVGPVHGRSLELIQSELRPEGSRYTTLVALPFGHGV